MSFKDRFKKMREDLGYNQLQFARLLKISQSSLSNWERGIGYPSAFSTKQITNILGKKHAEVDLEALINPKSKLKTPIDATLEDLMADILINLVLIKNESEGKALEENAFFDLSRNTDDYQMQVSLMLSEKTGKKFASISLSKLTLN